MRPLLRDLLLVLVTLGTCGTKLDAADLSGNITVETRVFPNDALYRRQQDTGLSVALEPEFYHDWSGGDSRFVVVPFARLDQQDSKRSHVDMRELYWRRSFASADLYVGIRKVFWGVTESVHLVDVINQTDLVENADTEDKLGQPMVQLTLLRDWGTLDLYAMSGFRQRTYAGAGGRLRPPLPVNSKARFESDLDRWHPDAAVRWSHTLGDYDIGVAHFYGSSRTPRLLVDAAATGPVLVPHHDLLHQSSLDLQLTRGGWLAKLEAVHRSSTDGRSRAVVAGLEYTLYGLASTTCDLGLIAEGQFDDRGAPFAPLSDNDAAFGGRLTFNDTQDTAILAFAAIDVDNATRFTSIEAERRWRSSGTVRLEARFFGNVDMADPLFAVRRDDYLQLEYRHYF